MLLPPLSLSLLTEPYSKPQLSMHRYWHVATPCIFNWPIFTVVLCSTAGTIYNYFVTSQNTARNKLEIGLGIMKSMLNTKWKLKTLIYNWNFKRISRCSQKVRRVGPKTRLCTTRHRCISTRDKSAPGQFCTEKFRIRIFVHSI